VLGILSDCRSSRDLEAFAKRHREALNQALGLNFKRWPTDATFLYLFNKAHLEQFGEVLQAWMISQIPGGATTLDQLVCDGKTLKGSAIETADGNHRFVAQVTVYARALGVALAQKNYDTHESSERAALKELLSTMNLEGKLIQADALHTTQAFFGWCLKQGADVALTVKTNQPTLHRQIHRQFEGKRQIPFTATAEEKRHGRDTRWELRAKEAPAHIKESWPGSAWIVELITTKTTRKGTSSVSHLFITSIRMPIFVAEHTLRPGDGLR